MESILTNETALSQELAFVNKHAASLATLKLAYNSNHVPAFEHLHKRATIAQIPVVQPPPPLTSTSADSAAAPSTPINLTLKSTKPPLSFALSCTPTSTIANLKLQLEQQDATAPKADQQRWILKGKAMGDNKLLMEFDAAKDGVTVNLMISKPTSSTTVPTPPLSTPSADEVPELTLSTPTSEVPTTLKPILSISTDPAPPSSGAQPLASPVLWSSLLNLLEQHFSKTGTMDDATVKRKSRDVWESWFAASLKSGDEISPGDKAKIREVVGLSAMGGV